MMLNKRVADMPASIRIGAVTYTITTDPDAWVRYEHENQKKGYYGHTRHIKATILISPDSTPDVARLTLWHEIQHALCETVMGSPNWLDLGQDKDDREETVIRAFESPTLLVLRDNPDLVAYLTAR
jgi:hypothetical protein